jgi:hypothetical protein
VAVCPAVTVTLDSEVVAMEKSCSVKLTPLLATPSTVTSTFPVAAPLGTVVVMLVALQFEFTTVAGLPLNVTMLVP